jgi:hypothetical protein
VCTSVYKRATQLSSHTLIRMYVTSRRFEVKVGDMGLSRMKDHAQIVSSKACLEGTVEYTAPEVEMQSWQCLLHFFLRLLR